MKSRCCERRDLPRATRHAAAAFRYHRPVNPRFDLYLLGWLLLMGGSFLLVPSLAALVFSEPVLPYLLTAALGCGVGGAMVRTLRAEDRKIRPRDGFLVVAGAWVAVSLLGAVPYLLSGVLGPVDAVFEAVSGFTTTGSTVITDTGTVPHALLLWRALTQWLGGMGIILFTIAILPLLGIGGMQLFKAEVPGPVADKVRPRLAATARSLWGIYVGLTACEWVALRFAGVGGYEALCHSFTTLATGGFSTRNLSVGELGGAAVQWIVIVFMVLAGCNFVLHYRVLTGKFGAVQRDPELRYYLGVVVVATVIIALALPASFGGFEATVRASAFQVVSVLTTTGYVTADFEQWPALTHVVVLILMVLGGMSGSTGGGIKSLRALLAIRSLRATLRRLVHPHAIIPVKYGKEVVSDRLLAGVWAFLTAYMLIAVVAAALLAALGLDVMTALSATLTAIGNVGPGLGAVGAYDNFAAVPSAAKGVLAVCMIFGRLEVFTVLALMTPGFWRR